MNRENPSMNEGPHFRFEDLDIWQRGKRLAVDLHELSNMLEGKKYYRYTDQLRGAALSVPNNIAEGSASPHTKAFQKFLNIARRSLFENVSMLLVFEEMSFWESGQIHGPPAPPKAQEYRTCKG